MHELAFVCWNIDPVFLQLGPLKLRYYGVLFALGFVVGYYIVQWIYRAENKPENDLQSLFTWMLLAAVIGARVVHCLFYEPGYYLRHPLEILAVWRGGLASHGGAIAILIALYFYTRRRPEQPYLWLLDRLVIPAALAGALIRLGNLFNSEILGTATSVPWAFIFQRIDSVPRHPVQLYESICYLLVFVVLLLIYRARRGRIPRGLLVGLFLVMVFTARFFLEFLKQRQAEYEQGLPISVGQMLSVPFVIAGLVLTWRASRRGKG